MFQPGVGGTGMFQPGFGGAGTAPNNPPQSFGPLISDLVQTGASLRSESGTPLTGQAAWEKQMESADQQQAQLFHRQWNLVKEQMGTMSRQLDSMRQELVESQFAISKNESTLREVIDYAQGLEEQLAKRMTTMKLALEGSLQEQYAKVQQVVIQLERQMQQLAGDHMSSQVLMRDVMETHKSGMDKAIANERSSRDNHRSETQASLLGLEKALQAEVAKLSSEHQASLSATQDMILEHKTSFEKQLSTQSGAHDEHRAQLRGGLQELEDGLRKEISCRATEHSNELTAQREALQSHRVECSRQIASAAASHDEQTRALADLKVATDPSKVKELVDGVRHALDGQLTEHRALHDSRLDEHRTAHQVGATELEKRLQLEYQQFVEGQLEHRAALERQLLAEQAAREAHRNELQSALEAAKTNSKNDLARFSSEHKSDLARFSCEHKDDLARFSSEHSEKQTAAQLGNERNASELRQLEAALRGELQGHAVASAATVRETDSELRGLLRQQAEQAASVHAALELSHADLRRSHSDWQQLAGSRLQSTEEAKLALERALDTLRERVEEHRDGHSKQLEAHRSIHQERLRDSLNTEREETTRSNSKLQEKLLEIEQAGAGHVKRDDLDAELQRLWQALDTHSHDKSKVPGPAPLVQAMRRPSNMAEPLPSSVNLPINSSPTMGSVRMRSVGPQTPVAMMPRASSARGALPIGVPISAGSSISVSAGGTHTPVAVSRSTSFTASGTLGALVPNSAGSSLSVSAGGMPVLSDYGASCGSFRTAPLHR